MVNSPSALSPLAAQIVTSRLVNGGYCTIREGGGVEPRRLIHVLVEPEANVFFGIFRVLLVLGQGERRGLLRGPCQ